jgi:hypothetical protein
MQGACFKTTVVQGAYRVASEQQYARRVLQDYCSAGSIQGSKRAAVCTVQGAGRRVLKVRGVECRMQSTECWVKSPGGGMQGCEVQGAGCRVQIAACMVQGSGCKIHVGCRMQGLQSV